MSNQDERVTVSVEKLTLSNSLQLTALVELLEEKGILTQAQVGEQSFMLSNRGLKSSLGHIVPSCASRPGSQLNRSKPE